MYLLDTNHCSALLAGNTNVAEKLKESTLEIITCSIVMGELIYMGENSEQRVANLLAINSFLGSVSILPADQAAAKIYGELKALLLKKYGPKDKKKRRTYSFKQIGVSDNDLWIASIGISNDATIVSQDGDFDRIKEVYPFPLETWV